MNHTVTDAFGIDAAIKRIQSEVYAELISRWSLTRNPSNRINGYGRVYKNPKDFSKVPEAYVGKREYEDVFYDDNADANFFFLVSDDSSSTDEMVFTNSVKVVFCMDLEKCISGKDRMDALAHKDAVELLRNITSSGRYVINGYETGLENIFSGYSTTGIKYDDLQPYHCFAVKIMLNYYLNDKCN
jgi:hypothetical protein